MLQLSPSTFRKTLSYKDKILLVGSCFAENIGSLLQEAKFQVLFNPSGIVFDPLSVATHLRDWALVNEYHAEDLFQQNELWHSWSHHSSLSSTSSHDVLTNINCSIGEAHRYLKASDYLFITLGTAYSYVLKEQQKAVANCHKVPQKLFEKRLLTTDQIQESLEQAISLVRNINPSVEIIFTVSPVKHIRDGIIENNRSKARLLDAVHTLVENNSHCTYFPAYELVTDVLRDYRFYAADMAHPSEQAIQFVFDHFGQTFLSVETHQLMQEVLQVVSAKNHRILHPDTLSNQRFRSAFLTKVETISKKLPMLDWSKELAYFS
jgi:hypothetical protein